MDEGKKTKSGAKGPAFDKKNVPYLYKKGRSGSVT